MPNNSSSIRRPHHQLRRPTITITTMATISSTSKRGPEDLRAVGQQQQRLAGVVVAIAPTPGVTVAITPAPPPIPTPLEAAVAEGQLQTTATRAAAPAFSSISSQRHFRPFPGTMDGAAAGVMPRVEAARTRRVVTMGPALRPEAISSSSSTTNRLVVRMGPPAHISSIPRQQVVRVHPSLLVVPQRPPPPPPVLITVPPPMVLLRPTVLPVVFRRETTLPPVVVMGHTSSRRSEPPPSSFRHRLGARIIA